MADDAPRPTPGSTFALSGVVGVLLGLAVFHGGGSGSETMLVVGLALAATVAVIAVGVCLGRIPVVKPGRAGWCVAGGASLLTLWIGCSLAWSITADVSWDWLNRTLVYLGFVVLGAVLAGFRHGRQAVVAVLTLVVAAVVGWALLGVVVPSLAPVGDRIGRLSEPVGYWNGLALLASTALVLGVAIASSRRVGGLLLAYGAIIVLLMTQSRGGLVVGGVMLALWLRWSAQRLADGLDLLLAAVPGLAVAGFAFTREALVRDDAGREARADDGKLFALVLALGAVAVVVAAIRVPAVRVAADAPDRVRRVLWAGLALAVVAGIVGIGVSTGDPATWVRDQVTTGECANTPDRLGQFCDNNRVAWWGDALEIASDNPVAGTGAGTYRVARLRVRDEASPAPQPHSLPLQVLADLGIVGLLLASVVAIGAVAAARRALRRVEPGDRGATRLLAIVSLGYGLHSLIDYDADFLAVTAPAAVALGALVAAADLPARPRSLGVPAAVAAVAVCAAAFGSLALPDLAARGVDRGYAALFEGDLETAARKARDARALNPLSREPIVLQSEIAAEAGDPEAATERLREAAELQPENPHAWVALGLHLFASLDPPDLCGAYFAYNTAYTLDPLGPAGVPDGPLDVAREAVNHGACE